MATAREAINKINSWIGLKEGPKVDKTIINPWNKVMKRSVKSKTTPWCAITVSSCFIQVKASGYSKSAACRTQREYYKAHKRWIAKGQRPAAGYVIFLKGHEGLVVRTSASGTSYYVAGNTSNAVKKCSFNWKKPGTKILGYGKPIYK